MLLTRLDFKRYKPFALDEKVDIRPLTILIGRNNSGKSALARLPVLLGHAFSDRAKGPLDLDAGGLDFGGSLLDLIHGRSIHGSIELGFRIDSGSEWFEWRVALQHYDEYKLQVIDQLEVVSSSGGRVRLERANVDPRPRSQVYSDQVGLSVSLEFDGLKPRGEGLPDVIERSLAAVVRAFRPVRYLGPFREPPRRDYRFPASTPRDVGPLGGSAADVLGADVLRGGGHLLRRVTTLFEKELGTGPVEVESYGDKFSVIVRDRLTGAPINLVDTGVGLGQVLSLIVQRMLDEVDERDGGLEIVEQPELHLHPQAHGALADLYVDAVAANQSTRFIVETHAENILLRVRRRIAEGRIAPEQVAIYWVRDEAVDGSRLMPIEVDEQGDVDVWPRGVFAEDFEEAKALARARSSRSGQE